MTTTTHKPITIGHLTDTHFNFLRGKDAWSNFFLHCKSVADDADVDFFVLTGDISEAPILLDQLQILEDYICRPVYFVCGNHDFYNGSIKTTRENVFLKYSANLKKKLTYLTVMPEDQKQYVPVSDTVAILGHDGWYDGVYADWHKSKVNMNDYHIISEFTPLYHNELFAAIQQYSKEASDFVFKAANQAIDDGFKKLVIATHVPPFRENAVYNGKISDNDWMPHFSSGFMGEALLRLAVENPQVEITTLCGHSHGEALHKANPNLTCLTGYAQYGVPRVSKIIRIE